MKSHIEADPLTVSGSLGMSMQSLLQNSDVYAGASPFALTAYGNFVVSIYGFDIPININFMDVSATQFSFPMPTFSLSVTPEWKNFRFHIGTSSMHFSNYTYSGLNFTGLGAEYNGKWLRVGAFYGKMQSATVFRERDDRSAMQYYADSLLGLNVYDYDNPQYKRIGMGAKLGVGNSRNYLDVSFFKAKDDTSSLPQTWTYGGVPISRDSLVIGKENVAMGLAGKMSIGKWFSLMANLGVSVMTTDLNSTPLNRRTLEDYGIDVSSEPTLDRVLNMVDKIEWLYEPRMSTQVRLAGDANANFTFSHLTAQVIYRFVQPDYASLGANRFSQNSHGGGANMNLRLFRNSSNISLSGYLQRDNLDGKQTHTNQVATFAVAIGQRIGQNLNMMVNYSGVKQDQLDGTLQVSDSARIDQLAHTLTLSPSYVITGDNDHTIALNFNAISNTNLNKLQSSAANVNTYSFGASYDIDLTAKKMNIGVNYDYTTSSSTGNSYTSHTLGGSFAYIIVKNDKLNLRANYSMNFSLNSSDNPVEESGVYDPDDPIATARTNDVSFSNRLGATFNYKKQHSAQLYLTSSNYSENIVIGQKISTKFDLRINLAYNYTFAYRVIKSKKKTESEDDKASLQY